MMKDRGSTPVHAPYNFVPLSGRIVRASWAEQISHDVPFSDGICGHLDLELGCVTPTCVGDRKDGDEVLQPFAIDGKPAIPGTAIKGMLRNVMEIVSFARYQLVDHGRRFALRDLSGAMQKEYREAVKNPRTGYLRRERDGSWSITPCRMSWVRQALLLKHCEERFGSGRAEAFRKVLMSHKQPCGNKYEAWQKAAEDLDVQFEVERPADQRQRDQRLYAVNLGRGGQRGRLVFTGQPQKNPAPDKWGTPGKKSREFVFHLPDGVAPLPVPEGVRGDFQFIHGKDQGERKGGMPRPNDEWAYWKERLDKGEDVPVFFHERDGQVASIGLAYMYRLAYRYNVGDAIHNTSKDHLDDELVDLPLAVFGYVPSGNRRDVSGTVGLKGRASFSMFTAVGGARYTEVFEGVLGNPKPTFYPSYLDQGTDGSTVERYRTFMEQGVELRGWKRYPVRDENVRPPKPGDDQQNVAGKWRAVDKGSAFMGRCRVHNLRPVELGALLWCLDFGGQERCLHSLGKAKPFGFGAVRLSVRGKSLKSVTGEDVSLADCRKAFEEHMEAATKTWRDSEQLAQLLAMADPNLASDHDLTYMSMGQSEGERNEHRDCKQKPHQVLPAYVPYTKQRDPELYPRSVEPPSPARDTKRRSGQRGQPAAATIPRPPRQGKVITDAGKIPYHVRLVKEIDGLKKNEVAGKIKGLYDEAKSMLSGEERREVWQAVAAKMKSSGFWKKAAKKGKAWFTDLQNQLEEGGGE